MSNNDFKNSIKCPIKDQQEDINKKMLSLLDQYQKSNSYENREFLCYLTAAMFLTYKKLYPQLSLYIPFRTKSDISYIRNIQKEFSKFITHSDLNSDFDIFPIIQDLSGLKIVLENINFSHSQMGESTALFNDPEIKKLLSDSHDNFHLLDKVDEYKNSSIKTGKQYFELKKQLLERIIDVTPADFTLERTPNPSFKILYQDVKYQYDYFVSHDTFPTFVSDFELQELTNLASDLRSRIHDPLHFEILRKTLPVVFEDPLIKDALKTNAKFLKESKKPNGFQSIYYILETPFGPIEAQAQSNKAFYASTKGSAYHSGIKGKTINVKDFFELVDSNDKHDISYYLDTLDSISADSMISDYEIPDFKTKKEEEEFYKTPRGIAYLESEKYREMMKHIKIKEKMKIYPRIYRPDINLEISQSEIEKDKLEPTLLDTDDYLFTTALSYSPYMNVCSSGHTSYTNASIHHKKVIGEFSEILRKRDSNTLLRDLLIKRLQSLIEDNVYPTSTSFKNSSQNIKQSVRLVNEHDKISRKLPKDISKKSIIEYAEKLRKKEEKSDSQLSK